MFHPPREERFLGDILGVVLREPHGLQAGEKGLAGADNGRGCRGA
ncbi:MAG: hypothetical protein ACLFU6_03645 [Candidatus Hydrogenedentota bacterium]